jgi:biopolymer transport protein ExbD
MNLRPRKRTTPAIPIVALVDILVIVLLFVVSVSTMDPKKKREKQLQIALPQSSALGSGEGVKETRTTLAINKEKKIFLDGKEVEDDTLAIALKEMKAAVPGLKLELQADTDTSLGTLVKVWDALKAAGFSINDVPARIQRAAAAKTAP